MLRIPSVLSGQVLATWLCAIALITAVASAPAAERGLEVGSISDLDLAEVRRLIEQGRVAEPPPIVERRSLSLEQSVKVALENNLRLQVVELGVAIGERGIAGARAKFHPIAGAEGAASGTKRAHSSRLDEKSDTEEAQVFLRQEVPTGGSVTLGAGYSREFEDENSAVNSGNERRTSELAGMSIEVRQPLLAGGRVYVARQRILTAGYDDEINRAELRAAILQVTAETKAAYYQVVRALRQIEVIERAIARDQELIRASKALFDAGSVSKVDVFSAEVRLSDDRVRLASERADLEVTQNELRRVLGLPVSIQIDVGDRTIPFRPVEIELRSWIERALEQRPELMKIRSQLEKSELAIRVSRNALLPSLDIGGAYQPGFDFKSFNWRADLGFSYPLGNVAARSKYEQAELQRDRVSREYTREKRRVDLEVREVEIRLRESVARLKNLTVQVESARSKGEIARGRFEMGLANNLDITNADEELIRSESLLLQALADYASNLALLEARIAGPISPPRP